MKVNIGEFLTRRAMLSPDKEALVCQGRRYTFSQMNSRANRLAHSMEKLGVRPGDRVGLLLYNSEAWHELFFGLAKIGAILVPMNYRLAAPELAEILSDAGVRLVVYEPEFEGLLEEAKADVPPFQAVKAGPELDTYERMLDESSDSEPMLEAFDHDELAIIYAVWGPEGPRGVLLSHRNFLWETITATATAGDLGHTFLLALPLFHIGGLAWLPLFMHRGIRCVLMPGFDADQFLELIPTESVTSFGAVPAMLYMLKDSERFATCDFKPVQSILAYGSAAPVELIKEYAGYDIKIRQLYGLTESAGPVLVIDGEHAVEKAGSCGLPFFHTRVKLINELGMEVPPGSVGEVIIQADHVMKGYWNQPEATADVLRNDWLYSGDLGRQDEDGFFYIVDRKKEMIISGGENIHPSQVEGVIMEHPGVADVAVIGCPDELWGELPKAVVVKKRDAAGLSEQEITEFCKGRLAGFKAPRQIEFVDSMPRTFTGKMEKRKLRQG